MQVLRESLVQINNDVRINSDEELSQEEGEIHTTLYHKRLIALLLLILHENTSPRFK